MLQFIPPHEPRPRRGVQWLSRYFAVGVNPGHGATWVLYYLYGVERAGRLSGQRFFGQHDWYREGASYLLEGQTVRDGSWNATLAAIETDKVVASSFALLFLSKGLAPVLINKLNYGSAAEARKADDDVLPNWNLHPNDVRNLTEYTSGLPHWPKLLTYQEVDLEKVLAQGSVRDLLQAPILYLSGADDPKFTDADVSSCGRTSSREGLSSPSRTAAAPVSTRASATWPPASMPRAMPS